MPEKSSPSIATERAPRRRLAPEDRQEQILQAAIAFFARHGFEASTRDLAS